jgi:hypothetical protein
MIYTFANIKPVERQIRIVSRVVPAPATFFGVLEPEERGHGEIWILVSAKMTEPARVPDDRQ